MKLKKLKVESPVKCSFCKEKKAFHKIQGHPYGGKTVCNDCWSPIKKKWLEDLERDKHMTEADYQTWDRL